MNDVCGITFQPLEDFVILDVKGSGYVSLDEPCADPVLLSVDVGFENSFHDLRIEHCNSDAGHQCSYDRNNQPRMIN